MMEPGDAAESDETQATKAVQLLAAARRPEGQTAEAGNDYVAGPIETHRVPADHYSLMCAPANAEIGRVLAAETAADSCTEQS